MVFDGHVLPTYGTETLRFVFALKTGYRHYSLDATKPSREDLDAESLLGEFVSVFKNRVEAHPTQWYNFFDFYVS